MGTRLYIGNLPMDMKEKDLEDIFYKFGKITDMQLKMPERPPAFGFVTFEDSRDADEAVRARSVNRGTGVFRLVRGRRGSRPDALPVHQILEDYCVRTQHIQLRRKN